MIDLQTGDFLGKDIGSFIIPSERVAHVQIGNNLEHALLVLTRTGYTAIPVLDPTYKFHGLISSPLILDAIMGLERIEFEKLEHLVVEDVMNSNAPTLTMADPLEKGLKLLINHPFICTVDEEGYFEGILTRRVVLKQMNALVHQLKLKEMD
ncbi:cyclic-di-AMP-binding protein CbpB [Bacillus andreraoultii]|uniref:cyclic-di-AMP-binding protein CbpB n=1 Tax=Bacillus andreraoultii TaxID=1499685 RepID=UPI00053BBC15|nr:cyclic-di-AMP-binding protein CbpB [Bacillus andreraoultii]